MNDKEQEQFEYQGVKGRRLEVTFDQQELSGDGGLLAISEHEKKLGLIKRLAGACADKRAGAHHRLELLIGQRLYQIISGAPDANDADRLRMDPIMQLASGSDQVLGSQPTHSRLENSVGKRDLYRMGHVIGQMFLESFDREPEMIVIDMDPTAHLVYGHQQLSLFNTHVGDHCLMPFHVYDGISGRLITAVIREGRTPAAREILSLLKRIIKGIRRKYPNTHLMFRADSHHTKPEVMDYLESEQVGYVTGLSPNKALERQFAVPIGQARRTHELRKQQAPLDARVSRMFASASYEAGTWSKSRRVCCRIQYGPDGFDVRYIVTSYEASGAKYLYETVYCGRGNCELYIKDHKLGLQSDRSACQKASANQLRLLLCSAAYNLMHSFREKLLAGTQLAKASIGTIRLKLIKQAAVVHQMKTRVRVHLSERCQYKAVFAKLAKPARQVPIYASG